MNKDKLRDIIWITRVSRVNAETRLLKKNNFIQGINIYYSCVTIIFSILTLFDNNVALSLVSVFMTLSLLVTIAYLNSLKYSESARDYRANYTGLYKLELELNHDVDSNRLHEIENEYCELLDTSCNHINFDYYCAVHQANEIYRKDKWARVKSKYYFGFLWRVAVKVILVLLPVILFLGSWWYNASI